MTIKDAVKAMMKDAGVNQTELGVRIGKKQGNIAMYLRNADSMHVDNLLSMANACGYTLAFVKKESDGQNMLIIGDGVNEKTKQVRDDSNVTKMFEAFQEWYESSHPGQR